MLANSIIGLLSLLCLLTSSNAVRIPVARGIEKRSGASFSKAKLLGTTNDAGGGDDVGLTTHQDLLYTANVTIGGSSFVLQLDTGSSDIWVATQQTIPDTNQTDLTHNLTYGIGYAAGPISTGPIEFAGFKVNNQAFLLATQANNPVSSYQVAGIFGLGFTSLSSIDAAVNQTGQSWGRSFLLNAFMADPSTPNFITFALQRSDDPDSAQGTFTIGEYVKGYEQVAQMPNISTFPENSPKRWNVLLDGFYIGGVSQSLATSVSEAPFGKAVALIDSGTSYSYIDKNIVQALYGSIQGASLDSSSGMWTVPCDVEVDVTLEIGGNFYPVHPLDVVDTKSGLDSNECVGTFIGQSLSVGDGEFDYLIGDNVLRSIYTLYDFGDFQNDGTMGNPYLKFLSLTNATEASADFHSQRGGAANSTISASGVNANSTSDSGSSVSSGDISDDLSKLLNYMPVLLGLMALNAVILLGLAGCAVFYFMRRSKRLRGGRGGDPNNYHYQRVRSQYDPKEFGPEALAASGSGSTDGVGANNTLRARAMPARQGSDQSIKSILKTSNSVDEPFTPPIDEAEGDVTGAMRQPLPPNIITTGPTPTQRPMSTSSSPIDPTSVATMPRPRFISTTTVGSNDNRPQSLFSVASGPLLANAGSAGRPMSTFEMGAPRPRYDSNPLSNARPDSMFSTSPLMQSRPRADSSSTSMLGSPIRGQGEMGDAEFMPPPRPRFMDDMNMGPRPASSFSLDAGAGPQVRPQSKFIDVSGGPRPSSEAM